MKKTQVLEKSDKWIVGCSAISALLLLLWLVYDIAFLNPEVRGKIEIGKIYETQNRVKRKFNRSLIWYPAQGEQTVYRNDWIFTGSDSLAKIQLKSGDELIVEPDSLIVLSQKNGVLELNLQHGQLLAEIKSKDVKVNLVQKDGKVKQVDASKGVIAVSKKRGVRKIPVSKKTKKKLSLSQIAKKVRKKPKKGYSRADGNGLSYKKNSRYKFRLYKGQKAAMKLKWSDPLGRWESYETQVSRSPQFKKLIAKGRSKKEGLKFRSKKGGRFYWRVRGLNKKPKEVSSWSPPLRLNVKMDYIEKAKPLPLAKSEIHYQLKHEELQNLQPNQSYTIPQGRRPSIQWQAHKRAKLYRLQFSKTKDFSTISSEKTLSKNQFFVKNTQIGKSYFRIIPEAKKGIPVAKASIGQMITSLPAPQKLITQSKKDSITLKWDPLPHNKAYEIKYMENGQAKTQKVSSAFLKLKKPTKNFSWRVRAINAKNQSPLSPYSKTKQWKAPIKKLASVPKPVKKLPPVKPKPKPIAKPKPKPKPMAKAKPKPISKPIVKKPKVIRPRITSPPPKKTFITMNNSPIFFVMKWDYPKEVSAYKVEISRSANMTQSVFKKTVETQRLVIRNSFKPGVYYMRVQALIDNDFQDDVWSQPETFRVMGPGQ